MAGRARGRGRSAASALSHPAQRAEVRGDPRPRVRAEAGELHGSRAAPNERRLPPVQRQGRSAAAWRPATEDVPTVQRPWLGEGNAEPLAAKKKRPPRGRGGPAGSRRGKRDDGGRGLDETRSENHYCPNLQTPSIRVCGGQLPNWTASGRKAAPEHARIRGPPPETLRRGQGSRRPLAEAP